MWQFKGAVHTAEEMTSTYSNLVSNTTSQEQHLSAHIGNKISTSAAALIVCFIGFNFPHATQRFAFAQELEQVQIAHHFKLPSAHTAFFLALSLQLNLQEPKT